MKAPAGAAEGKIFERVESRSVRKKTWTSPIPA
jgi:hypothetical protein